VPAFAEAFAAQAAGLLVEDDLRPVTHVDAVVPRGTRLTLDLCAELARLAPFGLGNPDVTLLAPGCELGELATVGEGKHLRFRVRRDGADAGSAIAFGSGGRLEAYGGDGRWDVAFRLEENRWNGTVAPQLVVRRIFAAHPRYDELRAWLAAEWKRAVRDPEAEAIFSELGLELGRRHLLESELFRALLEREPVLARAA
jgi:single-stranded-DNA-specific exonuclease